MGRPIKIITILALLMLLNLPSNAIDVIFGPTLDAANALSSRNKSNPNFGVFSTSWNAGENIILNTDDTVSGTGMKNHHGSHSAGSVDISGSPNADVTISLELKSEDSEPSESFEFSDPKCKWGEAGEEEECSSITKTIDDTGTSTVKIGATLTINEPIIADKLLDNTSWVLTISYS